MSFWICTHVRTLESRALKIPEERGRSRSESFSLSPPSQSVCASWQTSGYLDNVMSRQFFQRIREASFVRAVEQR